MSESPDTEYTPTTAEIREYVEVGGEPRPWEPERFDRRLAAHDAEVAAKALEDVLEIIRGFEPTQDQVDTGGESGLPAIFYHGRADTIFKLYEALGADAFGRRAALIREVEQ